MGVKCFLVEPTGNKRWEPCNSPGCDTPNCGNDIEEFKRQDTGETVWGYWATFGPGSMRVTDHTGYPCWARWTNCDGKHIEVITPDGHYWDACGRASNCDMTEEGTHRCWVVHGTPPMITADKNGHTCHAGAGSIQAPQWHGFLTNGELNPA